jgi:hypothetical protein
MRRWLVLVVALLSCEALALDDLRAAVGREVRDPARAARTVALVEELQRLDSDAKAENEAFEARLSGAATEAELRAAYREFNAKLDARQDRALDINQRMKAAVGAGEWEALPRVMQAPHAAAQELLGFMQTYDATAGDIQPVLRQLRAETAAWQEQAIRRRFPAAP